MFGNINDIRKKTEDNNENEACYGGFTQRFSYEELCRDGKKNRIKRMAGKFIFIICIAVFLGLFAVICTVSVYRVVHENASLYYPDNPKIKAAHKESTLQPINEPASVSKFEFMKNSVTAETVSPEVSQRYRIPTGIMVHDVCENSAAHKAGLLNGDIIVAINDAAAAEIENIDSFLSSHSEDTVAKITVFRNDTYIDLNMNIE